MTILPAPVLLVGCGKMGGALVKGWTGHGLAHIAVVEPEAAARSRIEAEFGIGTFADAAGLPRDLAPAAVVLAVKPQVMDQVAPAYRRFAGAVFLSIAAGTTIAALERLVGAGAIVRAMPNLPASIGRGITVACAAAGVTAPQRKLCQELLEAVGEVAWIEDEGQLDAVTAVSGSGPAYVFLLAECLADAGVAAGLEPGLAMRLAVATVSGSGDLLRQLGEPPARLRENVTSPGGTTAAALSVLTGKEGLKSLMTRAVAAAVLRSKELSGNKR